MQGLNIPAPDKGVLSHGEELEWNAMNTAPAKNLPSVPCPWQSYDTCRECGLYSNCYPLEVKHGAA